MSNTVEHQRLQNDAKSYIDQCRTCIEKNDYANVIKCANMVAENATKMNDGAYHVQNESDQETDNRYSKQQMADRIEHISKKITKFEAKLKEIKANDDEANNRIETDGRTATMAMPMSVELVTAGGRDSHQNVYIEPLDNADDVRLPFSETLQKHFGDEKAANLFERFLYDGHYDSDAIIDDAVIAPESNIFKYMHGLDESDNIFGAIQEDCVVEYLKQLYTERYELYMKHPKDIPTGIRACLNVFETCFRACYLIQKGACCSILVNYYKEAQYDAQALINLGDILGKGKAGKAIVVGFKGNPSDLPQRLNEFVSANDLEKATAAYEKYKEATELYALCQTTINNQETVSKYDLFKRNLRESIQLFSEAIQLLPYQPRFYMDRCEVFFIDGKYDEAIKDINTFIQMRPYDKSGYQKKVEILLQNQQFYYKIRSVNKVFCNLTDSDTPLYAITLYDELITPRSLQNKPILDTPWRLKENWTAAFWVFFVLTSLIDWFSFGFMSLIDMALWELY
eukprot:723777_1